MSKCRSVITLTAWNCSIIKKINLNGTQRRTRMSWGAFWRFWMQKVAKGSKGKGAAGEGSETRERRWIRVVKDLLAAGEGGRPTKEIVLFCVLFCPCGEGRTVGKTLRTHRWSNTSKYFSTKMYALFTRFGVFGDPLRILWHLGMEGVS